MKSFALKTNPRERQYGRIVSAVLETLQSAVEKRVDEGMTRAAIAKEIGCHPSQLSRVLNGRVRNITIRTISDILWATRHEPERFSADPYEALSHNGHVMANTATPKVTVHSLSITRSSGITGVNGCTLVETV